jgi:hypothetical protein
MNAWRSAVNNPIASRVLSRRLLGGLDSDTNLRLMIVVSRGTSAETSRCGSSSINRTFSTHERRKMKLSFGSVIAAALWVNVAQTQALPNRSGPGSSIPVSPDDRPLLSRPSDYPLSATGLTAGTPGPYLPNPNDPTSWSPTYPTSGGFPSLFVGE